MKTSPWLTHDGTRILPIVAVFGVLASCSVSDREWVSYSEEGRDWSGVASGHVVVGGAVFADRLEVDPFLDLGVDPMKVDIVARSDLLVPALESALRHEWPEALLTRWRTFSGTLPDTTVRRILHQHSYAGLLSGACLAACAEHFPDSRYLMLCRLERTSLDSRSRGDYGLQGAAGRMVRMTVDLYDLRTARSIWTATGEKYDAGPGAPHADDVDKRTQVERTDEGETRVKVPGMNQAASGLLPVAEACLRAILREMDYSAAEPLGEIR